MKPGNFHFPAKIAKALPVALCLILTAAATLAQENKYSVAGRQVNPAPKPRILPPGGASIRTTSPIISLRALTSAEIATRRSTYPTSVGQNRPLPEVPLRGNWQQNKSGRWFWSIAVQAISAGGVRLHFTGFDIGTGQVWVHSGNPDTGPLLGPFTAQGPLNTGDFWTEMLDGETAYVEYSPEDGLPGRQPPFAIPEIFHLTSVLPASASNVGCFLDERCYESNSWVSTFSRGVAYLVFPTHTCSGTLITDRNETGTPYLITAGHCILDDSDAAAMLAVFDFKTSGCNGTANGYNSYPQVSGSALLSRNLHTPDGGASIILDQPDFAFVQLPHLPNAAYSQLGWNTSPANSDLLTSVSHPRNLPQRLASGNITSSSDPNFYTIHLNQGAVDHGSSGSGIVNESPQLVAVDSYSSNTEAVSACDITDRDYGYTRFGAVYPYIQKWLEAAGSPKPVASLSPVSVYLGSQQVFTISGSQSSVLSNIGKGPLSISSITVQGANAAEFSQTGNCIASIAANASCTLTFTFHPLTAGAKTATVTIVDNAADSPQNIALSGTATSAVTVPVVLNQVPTNINVLANGGTCHAPAPVTSFLTTAPAVWLYFDVTGASLTDVYHIVYYKPDGSIYTILDAKSTFSGYECFSYDISVAGFPPASFPGNWTIRIFWNQQTTALVTRNFIISMAPPPPPSPGQTLQLRTVAPCRIMDTRRATGTFGGPLLSPGLTRNIPIPSSACGIPSTAAAYSLNFTVVPRTSSLASLTAWPAGSSVPRTTTLTSPDGAVIAAAAIVPAGSAGAISAYATDFTDLIVDINGYFVPPAADTLQFYPLLPCRVLDSRGASGAFGGPALSGGGSGRPFPVASSGCGAPATAAAYSLNVTVVPRGTLGYLTAWPAGQDQPFVSTLNSYDGAVIANAAIVPAGIAGSVSFFASNTTDIVVDINGYFAAPGFGGLNFYTLSPCRLVDTRNATGALGGPTIPGGTLRNFPLVQGSCGIPAYPAAQAYSLSMTAIPQGVLGYLSTWPAGGSQPFVSTLNSWKGTRVSNAALVPASTTGAISVFVTTTTDLTIDTAGYFGP